jgi:hypothetical protein
VSEFVQRENVYTCQTCGRRVTTIDREEGVTPFMIMCSRTGGGDCTGDMHSAFYPKGPRPPHIEPPSYEWYKPVGAEYDALSEIMKTEHVDRGGLILRKIGADTATEEWQ